jgi:hypothetical protein
MRTIFEGDRLPKPIPVAVFPLSNKSIPLFGRSHGFKMDRRHFHQLSRMSNPEFQATPARDASYVLKLLVKTLDTEVTTVAEGGSFPLGKDHVSFVDLAAVLGAAEPLGAELAENEVGVLRRVRAADHDTPLLTLGGSVPHVRKLVGLVKVRVGEHRAENPVDNIVDGIGHGYSSCC